ncbi:MAG: phosphodiester glycosidase family protein [Sandaracinaceae bacterium]|nr:phosphodiester glycosidase family protein [Sandaracinaceae bacterium]
MTRAPCFVALAALAACAPPSPSAAPAPPAASAPAEGSLMTLTVREVREDGWSGRLVDVAFTRGPDRGVRVLPSERPRPLPELVARVSPPQPFAAIDGGFYDTDERPMGLVRTGGRDVSPLGERGGSGVLYVEDGVPHIVHRDDYRASARVMEALQSIDRLVDDGASLVAETASPRRAARAAVALDQEGTLHLVVAFDERAVLTSSDARIELGPDSTRSGPTIGEWAALLARAPAEGGVGARVALGLDGGVSTSLVVKSEGRSLTIVPHHATINALVVSVNDS